MESFIVLGTNLGISAEHLCTALISAVQHSFLQHDSVEYLQQPLLCVGVTNAAVGHYGGDASDQVLKAVVSELRER